MTVNTGAYLLAVFAFDEMRDAHRELDHFDAALHRPARVGERLAMLGGYQLREFVLAGFEQFAKAHEDARPTQRRRVAPRRKRALRRLHRGVDIGRIAERHTLGDLARRRVGDVAGARARRWFLFTVYPQRHGRHGLHINRFIHLRSP